MTAARKADLERYLADMGRFYGEEARAWRRSTMTEEEIIKVKAVEYWTSYRTRFWDALNHCSYIEKKNGHLWRRVRSKLLGIGLKQVPQADIDHARRAFARLIMLSMAAAGDADVEGQFKAERKTVCSLPYPWVVDILRGAERDVVRRIRKQGGLVGGFKDMFPQLCADTFQAFTMRNNQKS
jgi:hypothetical protein